MHTATGIPGKRTTLAAALALWVAAWAVWTADWLLQPMPFMLERALRRIPVCLAGFALSCALIIPLRRTARRPFIERLTIALGLCLAASSVQALINETAYYVIAPKWGAATW